MRKKTDRGKLTDKLATVFLFNFLKDNTPFQAINIKNLSHFLFMIKESDFPHILCRRW